MNPSTDDHMTKTHTNTNIVGMCADLSLIFCNMACSPSPSSSHSTPQQMIRMRRLDIGITIENNIDNNNNNNIDKESESPATVDPSAYDSCGGHYHNHFQYHCNPQSLPKNELPATVISDSQNPKTNFETATTSDTANDTDSDTDTDTDTNTDTDTDTDTENDYLLPPQASTLPEAPAALSPCVRNVRKILGPRPYYLDSYLERTDSQRKRDERNWRDLRRQRQKRRWKRLLGELVRSIAPRRSPSPS